MAAKPRFDYDEGYGKQHSQSPISTGTSVLGIAFDKGVVVAADNLASYGSMARFRGVQRVVKVNDKAVLGCGGDYADFQYLMKHIEQKVIDDDSYEDGHQISARSLHSWITRIQYNKRSKFDPLWCTWVVGGLDDQGKPYLGFADKLGTAFQSSLVATGFSHHLAMPLMREECQQRGGKFTEEEAIKLIEKCLTVLHYRDARSLDEYSICVVNDKGSRVEGPFKVKTNWDMANMVTGYI